MTDSVADAIASAPEQSARVWFTDRLRAYAELHPELSAGEVSAIVSIQLLDEDRPLAEAFFIQEGQMILSLVLRTDIIQTRRGIYQVINIANPNAPEFDKVSPRKRKSIYERITRWREFDPITGRTQLLLTFTKIMLLESARHDAQAAIHHGWKSSFKSDLAERLPDDSTVVGDHFTSDQIVEIMSLASDKVRKDIDNGDIRLHIKPMGTLPGRITISGQTHGGYPARS